MPCKVFPEGIADKAFPADSSAPLAVFYATVKLMLHELAEEFRVTSCGLRVQRL